MADTLFREEVMRARQAQWLGGIVLGQPLSLWLLSSLAAAAAGLVVLFLSVGEYTRRTGVSGQLVPQRGVSSVTAPSAGVLSQVRVQEGQRVLAGDVLAVLAMPGATEQGGDTAQALQATLQQRRDSATRSYRSQRQQLQAQQAGVLEQIAATRAELSQLDAERQTRQQQVALAEQTLQRFRSLHAKQFVTDLQLQQQQTLALDQRGQAQSLQRQSLGLRRQLAQLQQAQGELPARFDLLDAAQQRESAGLDQESLEASSRAGAVITSPVSGMVSTLLGQAGQAVQSGQPLVSVLPAASVLEAHLWVPSRAVGLVKPGDAVWLRYHAFPYQKFGHHRGVVARISRSALTPAEAAALIGNQPLGEPYYRIVVALDRPTVPAFGREEALKPGMALDADILGERRPLWQWTIEPLLVLSGTVTAGR